MNEDDYDTIRQTFPDAEIASDLTGQVIIYTGEWA
tara:strand:+ start:998 stop:1102 length:105 start_codon:yes stop_codon:yes gene_type:complete